MNFTTFLSTRDETADAVAAYQAHSDFRTIASFTLGWVFLLACRHVIHAPFTHTLGRALCTVFRPAHQHLQDAESTNKPLSLMHMNLADVASSLSTRDGSPGQRFAAFLLFWALVVSSMTQFLSLVVFGNGLGYESLCAATLGLGAASSVAARVLGILILSLELQQRFHVTIYELATCWFLLISALGVTGGTIFFSLGQVTVLPNLDAAICVKQHFMPTSLTVSLTLIVLELYTLTRLLIGISLPRGFLDVRVSRTVALLVFDLAVLVPDAVPSNVLGDFIPFSVGAVIVLAAFAPRSTVRDCEQILLASSKASSTSPRSSVMESSFFEPPQPIHMAQPPHVSPALSERAMNELLMNGPSYGGPTPMRRLSDQERRKRESLAALPFAAKQLPKLPPASLAGHTDTEGPRSDVATFRSSMSRGANSAEGAILTTATREPMPPGLAVAMPVTTPISSAPLSGKILQPEQLAAYDRATSSGNTSAGLAPPPRSAIRPQLVIDTSGRKPDVPQKNKRRESRRVSFLNINSSSTPGHLAPPPILDVSAVPSRERSMVSPANMIVPMPIGPRRSSPNSTPRTTAMRSPEAASSTFSSSIHSSMPVVMPNSAPALHGEVAFVGDEEAPVIFVSANSAAAARKSTTGTFGRRSTRVGPRQRLPDVPHTPTDADSLPDATVVQAPGPWVARPVAPLRVHRGPGVGVRGPRARPPTSAPPM
ncbi:hypothetical protein PENSPDRAFT_681353 [Peniophora sp. CONT]|nr:hypothetical protein PENSPDRAFT_681353 [Peniophora sp. CONT]